MYCWINVYADLFGVTMRNNQPITNKEYDYPSDWMLLSITDENSIIKHVNDSFCEVAGFTLEEMKGQPHNMVRHPDMPSEIFDDMWNHIRKGEPWKGLVKNRCANGDHYWVDAFVTPIMYNGIISEYQSVRTKPSQEQIIRAEKTYKKINNKEKLTTSKFQVSLYQKLILTALISLIPLIYLSWQMGGWSWLMVLFSLLSLFGGGKAAFIHFEKLVDKSQKIYDNSLMAYLYTGRNDDTAKIELAMLMRSSELKALLGRALESCKQSEENALISSNKTDELKINRIKVADEVERVVSAMSDMTMSLKSMAELCSEAERNSQRAKMESTKSDEIVTQTVTSIELMSTQLVATSDAISELENHSKGIGSVLDVIQGIAEQTNLLALNAAIEAARAGEQGRGFAVVADEVRALAKRTHESTTEIQHIINLLQEGTVKAVDSMNKGVSSAQSCVAPVSQASEALKAINEAVSSITVMAKKIAERVEIQSNMSNDVSQSVVTVHEIMNSTNDLGEETVKLNRDVLDKIGSQKMLVEQFLKHTV